MSAFLARLPLQLVCQLIVAPETPVVNSQNVGNALTMDPLLSQILPDGYVKYNDIGMAYKIHNDTGTWQDGRKRCIDEGGQLGLIDSFEKVEYVKNQRGFSHDEFVYVGIHSFFDDEEWVSVREGKPVASLPWGPNEPSGSYKCVMLKTGGLSNDRCDILRAFVCELPIPKS